jgi:hypothetical protein
MKEALLVSQKIPVEEIANLRLVVESLKRTAEYANDIAEIVLNLTVDSVLDWAFWSPEHDVSMHLAKSSITKPLFLLFTSLGTVWLAFGSISAIAAANPSVSQSILFLTDQFPGVPLPIEELASQSSIVIGISVAILGLDMLLIGLGLWVKHNLARWIGMFVFALAAYFDFTQFLLLGFLGASGPTVEVLANLLVLYLLFKSNAWSSE